MLAKLPTDSGIACQNFVYKNEWGEVLNDLKKVKSEKNKLKQPKNVYSCRSGKSLNCYKNHFFGICQELKKIFRFCGQYSLAQLK